MISEFTVAGVTFHLYGLILGIAISTGLQITYSRLKDKFSISESSFYTAAGGVLVVSILGARLWHVVTDYYLYIDNWRAIFSIWNGGLSILGGLLFGGITIFFLQKKKFSQIPVRALLDSAAIGFPFGQAIGRWGNYINQELYGRPTSLPWGIFIEATHRLPNFENIERYHPLFLYEALGMVAFGIFLWKKQKSWKLGSGAFIFSLVGFYAGFRFLLDFLRIDKPQVLGMLGINQLILLILLGVWMFFNYKWNVYEAKNSD